MNSSRLIVCAVFAGVVSIISLPAHSAKSAGAEESEYFEEALTRYEKGDLKGAQVQLKNALKRNPEMLAALVLLGKTQVRIGEVIAAVDTFEKAIKLGVDRTEVFPAYPDALLYVGRADRVLDWIRPEAFPTAKRPQALLVRGHAYVQMGKLQEALQSFRAACDLNPLYSPGFTAQAEVELRLGNTPSAIALAANAVNADSKNAEAWAMKGATLHAVLDLKAALEAYGNALALDRGNLEARVGRASILVDLGKLQEAQADVQYLQEHMPLEPRGAYLRGVIAHKRGDDKAWRAHMLEAASIVDQMDPFVLPKRAPKLLLLAGLVKHALGQNEAARKYIEIFLQGEPGHLGAAKVLSAIYLSSGDSRAATRLLENALNVAPNDAQVNAMMAAAQIGNKRTQLGATYLERALTLSRSSPKVHAAMGMTFLEQGAPNVAIEHLLQAFKKDPKQTRVGLALAILHLQEGQARKAVERAELTAAHSKDDVVVLNLLGVARGIAGDQPGARVAYEQALRVAPNFLSAHLNLARLDRIEGKFAQAKRRLDQLSTRFPGAAQIHFEQGLLAQAQGNDRDATDWYQRAHDRDPKHAPAAVALIEALVKAGNVHRAVDVAKSVENLNDADLFGAIGQAYLAGGENKQAVIWFERMARVAAQNPRALYQAARLMLAAGDEPAANAVLSELRRAFPDFAPAHGLTAEIHLANGRLEEAELRAKLLLESQTTAATGHKLLGDIALRRNQYDSAVQSYQRAIKLERNVQYLLAQTRAYVLLKQTPKAIKAMETWLTQQPDDVTARAALAELYLSSENLKGATLAYQELIRRQGEKPEWLNNLAHILWRTGDGSAIGMAQRAHSLAPTDASISDTLGWILVQKGRVEAGLAHLREARLRAPDNPEIRYHLAVALAKVGRDDEALKELDLALASAQPFDERQEAARYRQSLAK